ncbi:hypothetical protein NL676_006916 [Syzygium grande]|nr:hypothetical protein NL676_006916 [Syzygium grande]
MWFLPIHELARRTPLSAPLTAPQHHTTPPPAGDRPPLTALHASCRGPRPRYVAHRDWTFSRGNQPAPVREEEDFGPSKPNDLG